MFEIKEKGRTGAYEAPSCDVLALVKMSWE